MEQSHRDKAFEKGEHDGPYLWCLHCERAYERGKWRNNGDLQMCPYVGCNGDAVIDAWDWEAVRQHHPDYPEIPEFGKSYPLYK